jgi:cyclic dehypoxanthinyl futalosine synthase
MGGTMMEENVVSSAGTTYRLPPPRMDEVILDAGYEPRRRTTHYEVLPAHLESPVGAAS